ncbi:unnamed protein product [Leptosia nina]|uniref:Uncharacterized protein n=1 Tax=Leptosia nina TaxID=320188 RepID=A0AAV1K165_9NEOP
MYENTAIHCMEAAVVNISAIDRNKPLVTAPAPRCVSYLWATVFEEPATSGDSGDESGSELEFIDKPMQNQQDWNGNNEKDLNNRESPPENQPSTSSANQEENKTSQPSLPRLLPKIDLPGGAMLYPSGRIKGRTVQHRHLANRSSSQFRCQWLWPQLGLLLTAARAHPATIAVNYKTSVPVLGNDCIPAEVTR